MFALFVGIAIFIACLGLFVLASFSADRRTREFGLRKVFGARSRTMTKDRSTLFPPPDGWRRAVDPAVAKHTYDHGQGTVHDKSASNCLLRRVSQLPRGKFRVHMRTTSSHAKLILLDTIADGWVAAVGSCNLLSSPFESVELSVILRDQNLVAEVTTAIQHLGGRRGLADDLANEIALTARELRRAVPVPGPERFP